MILAELCGLNRNCNKNDKLSLQLEFSYYLWVCKKILIYDIFYLNNWNSLQNHLHIFYFTDVNDIDTPLKNVTIRVVDIVSGYIAMKGDLENPVDHFTQADIDNRQVIFVHKSKDIIFKHFFF